MSRVPDHTPVHWDMIKNVETKWLAMGGAFIPQITEMVNLIQDIGAMRPGSVIRMPDAGFIVMEPEPSVEEITGETILKVYEDELGNV